MNESISVRPMYYYVSSQAGFDPCKTIYLCPPGKEASTEEDAMQFAIQSGWQTLAEEQKAILVVPVAKNGWKKEETSLLMDTFHETRGSFHTRSGEAVWGRSGYLYCWETMIYVVGYEDGAVFAGNVLVKNPNMFAGAALINGVPDDYSGALSLSSHWMVENVSDDYQVRNCDIPVHLWLFEEKEESTAEAVSYFSKCMTGNNKAEEIRCFYGEFSSTDESLSRKIFEECFNHVIRWKTGPDGTLALIDSKKEFYENPRYNRHTAAVEGNKYNYFVHLPEGKTKEQVKNLPLVFTVHGRGENAWMFMTKNGWDRLADETGEFVLVSPDCPGNNWFILRDQNVFGKIISQMAEEYEIDANRVYLTGFSNGAVITREMAYCHPELFAAISPSNGPWFDSRSMQLEDESKPPKEISREVREMMEKFECEGWEMPSAFFYGDSDPVAKASENPALNTMIHANHCEEEPSKVLTAQNYFTIENGYQSGERFYSTCYAPKNEKTRVCVTVMKNMPHGTITEESHFAWNFLKSFRRENGNKKIDVIGEQNV